MVILKNKKKKLEVWSYKIADKKFSELIRKRDGKCVNCGKTSNLQCSHYWSRKHWATRYDFMNCDTLCAGCHFFKWETDKQGKYQDYMLKKLGKEKYEQLKALHYKDIKKRDAIWEFQSRIGEYQEAIKRLE